MKYNVNIYGKYSYNIEVEAESEDEAVEKAREIDDAMSLEEWNEIVTFEFDDVDVEEIIVPKGEEK